jgi:hypothetical protein
MPGPAAIRPAHRITLHYREPCQKVHKNPREKSEIGKIYIISIMHMLAGNV